MSRNRFILSSFCVGQLRNLVKPTRFIVPTARKGLQLRRRVLIAPGKGVLEVLGKSIPSQFRIACFKRFYQPAVQFYELHSVGGSVPLEHRECSLDSRKNTYEVRKEFIPGPGVQLEVKGGVGLDEILDDIIAWKRKT